MRRKIGVIGTVIKDRIHSASGEITDALGGVLYTILPLRAFLPEDFEIVPILRVGRDLHIEIMEIFENLPNVSTVNTIRDESENNRVDLYYHSEGERTEVSTAGVSPTSYEEIQGLDELDHLIVNFISGWEISLSTMERLAGSFHARIFSDIHSLLLGRREDGGRYPRKPPGWEQWLKNFHYVQMNVSEARTSTGVEIAGEGDELINSLTRASSLIHQHGPGIVAITLGALGAFLTWVKPDGRRAQQFRNGYEIDRTVDPTGSGDVFLASFASASLLGEGCCEALSFAVKAAALSTTTKGASGLYEYFRESGLKP